MVFFVAEGRALRADRLKELESFLNVEFNVEKVPWEDKWIYPLGMIDVSEKRDFLEKAIEHLDLSYNEENLEQSARDYESD